MSKDVDVRRHTVQYGESALIFVHTAFRAMGYRGRGLLRVHLTASPRPPRAPVGPATWCTKTRDHGRVKPSDPDSLPYRTCTVPSISQPRCLGSPGVFLQGGRGKARDADGTSSRFGAIFPHSQCVHIINEECTGLDAGDNVNALVSTHASHCACA